MKVILIISFILVVHGSYGQTYKLVFSEPVELNDSLNSKAEEVLPLLSNDGKTLYFVRAFAQVNVGGEQAGQDIWYSTRIDQSSWSNPNNFSLFNTESNNAVIGSGNSDSILYLLNTYSSPLRWDYGISFSKLENGEWNKPRELNIKFDAKSNHKSYFITPGEDIILMSAEGKTSNGKEDLYVYVKNGNKWNDPIHLGANINTKEAEISPFLSANQDTLFFSSEGLGGFGSMDIFMTKKRDSTWVNWSDPINLGPIINSSKFDAYFSTYERGESFFASNKNGKLSNIYSTNMSLIKELIEEDTTELVVKEEEPIVEEPKKEEVKDTFTVQILAMPIQRKPEDSFFDRLGSITIENRDGKDGLKRFFVGEYLTIREAQKAMKLLRTKGYEDAFVRKIELYSRL